jgi:RIO kinase 1
MNNFWRKALKNLQRKPRWDDDDENYVNEEQAEASPFEPFFDNGWIAEVEETLKSGKEATVYRCKAQPHTGVDFFAVKVYRERENRNFKNSSVYEEGRVILDAHARRAVKKKTAFGREAQSGLWVGYEYEHLKTLHKAGADIPRPYVQAGNAILMEYLGDARAAAPVLNHVELEDHEVRPLFEQVMRNIELWLKHNLIHSDLSAYNILYWDGRLKIIDFPQAVDPRFNTNALTLLKRDIENVCRYFNRYGLGADSAQLAERLWKRFMRSHL